MSSSPTLELTPARQKAVTAILACAGMCAAFMQTILIPIQGHLPKLLNAPASATAWVITITLLTAAIAVPISGKLGDMFGKRLVALVLLATLSFSTAICALSSDLTLLIIGRGLQGVGMGIVPIGISILRDRLPRERLTGAVALVSATLGVGGAIGLPISALITLYFEWHMLFVVASVLGAASFLLVLVFVPKDSNVPGGKVDLWGAIGLSILLTSFLLALSRGNIWGWTSWKTLAAFGLAALTALIWGRYELRQANPLVDLRLSAKPAILMTNLASIALGFGMFSSSVAFPQLLQLPQAVGGAGEDLLSAAIMLMPAGVAMLVLSPLSARLQRRFGPRRLLVLGSGIIAAAYVLCLSLTLTGPMISFINMIIGIGVGLGYASMPSLIMRATPQSETASANSVNTLMRALGTTLAAAVAGAILAAHAGADIVAAFPVIFALGCSAALVAGLLAFLIPERRLA